MKINGITVGTPTPRSNYNQTDPKKADYIIGREKIQKAIHIGSAFIYVGEDYGSYWNDGVDVTDTITYKPGFMAAWDSMFQPMSFETSVLGRDIFDGYRFYSHYCRWHYPSLSFDLYFHAYTDSGELKIVKLHYQYTDVGDSAPQSITAYLVETEAGGVTEEYVDAAIRSAILDSWEAEV